MQLVTFIHAECVIFVFATTADSLLTDILRFFPLNLVSIAADHAVPAVEEPRLEDLPVEPLVLFLVEHRDELDAELVAARLRLGPVVEHGRVQLQVVALVAVTDHVELAEV